MSRGFKHRDLEIHKGEALAIFLVHFSHYPEKDLVISLMFRVFKSSCRVRFSAPCNCKSLRTPQTFRNWG